MAPLRVAGLMEFHVFETEPLILRTYCIAPGQVEEFSQGFEIKSQDEGVDKEETRNKEKFSGGERGVDSEKKMPPT